MNYFQLNDDQIRERWNSYFQKLEINGRVSEHLPVFLDQRFGSCERLFGEDGTQLSDGFFEIYPHESLEPNKYVGLKAVHEIVFDTRTGEIMQPEWPGNYEPDKEKNHLHKDEISELIPDREIARLYVGPVEALTNALRARSVGFGVNARVENNLKPLWPPIKP